MENDVTDAVENDWYAGTIVRKPSADDFWFAELSNGTEVFIFRNAVVTNRSHYCMRPGDEVALRVTPTEKGWRAVECRIQNPRHFSEPEFGVVTKVYDSQERFFIKRDCGCDLYAALGRPMDFEVGDRVAATHIVLGRNDDRYLALRLDLVEEVEILEEETNE